MMRDSLKKSCQEDVTGMSQVDNKPLSVQLRELGDPIWEAQHAHPFVRGIGDGTLDPARFGHWLRQDYLYLIDYAKLIATAVLRAPDLETTTTCAGLLHGIMQTEMDLHRSYAAGFGITTADLKREVKAPTCQGYTDFLLRVATTGDFTELLAALLPCIWGYAEIGQRLAARGMPDDARYAAWIEMYAGEEFAALGAWCRDLVDRSGAGLPDRAIRRMEEAFITSSRYELAFWEMAWTGERWAV
jgi:thiaminase (transcriptional activator TenA)